MKIAVAGGTGLIGQLVVVSAQAAGHEARVLSRARGVDLVAGTGVDEALAGFDAVIDVTNVTTMARRRSVEFFGGVTRTLLGAEARHGVGHHVALSIVGIDRVPLGYYAGKLEQERVIAAGDVPWTVLRATQFHEFPGQLLERMRGPVVLVPPMRSATVAAAEVAAHLVELAAGSPAGRAPDMAGPEERLMPDLVRRALRARGSRKPVLAVPMPGAVGKAMADGGLLPVDPDAVRGTQTFDEWLAST